MKGGHVLVARLNINIHSYIGAPYWPETEQVINIVKQSGMSRARSSANARKALEEHLRAIGMTLSEYDRLVELSQRPWYTENGAGSRIVIPGDNVAAMLVATCDTLRAAQRPCPPEQVRVALRCSTWKLNVTAADAKEWVRFAVVSSGTGAKLSNQRGLRRNWYVGALPPNDRCEPTKPVYATGTIELDDTMVRPEVLENALRYAGDRVGIGSSRKMGWGRFAVEEFAIS
jgi:hypothetical protein